MSESPAPCWGVQFSEVVEGWRGAEGGRGVEGGERRAVGGWEGGGQEFLLNLFRGLIF